MTDLSRWFEQNRTRFQRPVFGEIAQGQDFAEPATGNYLVVKPEPASPEPAMVGLEVASSNDGRDLTLGWVDALPYLPNEDKLLEQKGDGTIKLYEDLYSDPDVKIAWDQRSLGLVAREWTVEPGASDRQSKKAADQLREVLKNIYWDSVCQKMQFGVVTGLAFSECLYAKDGANITLEAVKVKKARRFRFTPDGRPLLLTTTNAMGERLPPRKFWQFRAGAIDDDNAYGLGLGHWLYWCVWFRRNGEKFWAVYLEKFGMPTAVGEHPAAVNDPREIGKLLAAVQAIHRDSAITISDNMKIRLLEATRASGGDYDVFIARWESLIYRLIVGQDFTIQAKGGQNKGDNLMDVFGAILKADSDLLNFSFSRQVATWLRDWNYPGAAVPSVWRRFEDIPDLKDLSETQKNIFTFGYRPTLAQVTETYGGQWEAVPTASSSPPPVGRGAGGEGSPAAQPPQIPTDAAQVTFSESVGATGAGAQKDALAGFVERMGKQADPLINKLLDPVRKLLADSADLAEVESGLAGLYAQMDADALAKLLAEGFVAAELAGRYELQHNTGLE